MSSFAIIRRVKEEHGWMHNMSAQGVQYTGETYHTAEALFQALRFDDEAIRAAIRRPHNPLAAKHTAYSFQEFMSIEPRSPQDLENMRLVLRLKIEQHPELELRLLATGSATIVEDCTHRQHGSGLFWGAALQGDDSWQGKNWLGRLWMELRASIRDRPSC